jgi:molybdenum cofactor sulfurtransferase
MFFSKKKSATLSQNNNDDDFFQNLRQTNYAFLDQQNQVYLDYTGGNLTPKSLIEKHGKLLTDNILGNPHSTNPTSKRATYLVEESRKAIVDFFNAHDYECIFTANASGALKIIGESYPFNEKSTFILTSDNHNSVNGIREFCNAKKGTTKYAPVHYEDLLLDEVKLKELFEESSNGESNLFAFPAQSNVSGIRHDLSWITYAQEHGFDVLLDAAAYVPTSKLDLSVHKPDFVSVSFYKIFGYPTGIGCLLVKKSSFHKLHKPWFAGGTVTMVSVVSQHMFLANGHERFEDGTLSYNTIPCVKFGLDYINSIGMERISKRINYLARYIFDKLKELKHDNGTPLVKIFGPEDFANRGGNMIVNFFDANHKKFDIEKIEKMANENAISIRSGCFCNPGIDEINNCIATPEMQSYFSSRDKGDHKDIDNYLGKMRGATRISVGLATNREDLDTFIKLIKTLKNKKA